MLCSVPESDLNIQRVTSTQQMATIDSDLQTGRQTGRKRRYKNSANQTNGFGEAEVKVTSPSKPIKPLQPSE